MDKNELQELSEQADELLGPEEKYKDFIALLQQVVEKIKSNEDIKADMQQMQKFVAESHVAATKDIVSIVDSIKSQKDYIDKLGRLIDSNKIYKVVEGQEMIAKTTQKEIGKITDEFRKGLDKLKQEHEKVFAQIIKVVEKLSIPPAQEPETVFFDWNNGRLEGVVEDFGDFKLRHAYTRDSNGRITRIVSKKT